MDTSVYIMAGGSGTRLAPLSLDFNNCLPKQFLAFVSDKTMLQETVLRVPDGCPISIISEKRFEDIVKTQLENVEIEADIISEPFGCNTAAAVLLGCLYDYKKNNDLDRVLFFMPADHIMETIEFFDVFSKAARVAYDSEKIVTIGIVPNRPETGYGYIKVKKNSSISNELNNEIIKDNSEELLKTSYHCDVEKFVEKPDFNTAKKYVESGSYLWNAGIFAFKIKTIFEAMKKNIPKMYNLLFSIKDNLSLENVEKIYTEIKEKGLNISIDYAVMEFEALNGNMLLIPASDDLEWNDVGGWLALEKYLKLDDYDNAIYSENGKINSVLSRENLIFNYLNKNIVLEKCDNLLVVLTENGCLISSKKSANRAKEIIAGIQNDHKYDIIDSENIIVKNTSSDYLFVIGVENMRIENTDECLTIREK
jgi:mannose-1-phosphate guanylyltransferase